MDAVAALAEDIGEPVVRWQAKTLAALRSYLTGDLDRSQQEAEAALSLGAQSVPEAIYTYAAQLIDVQCLRARWSELGEMADLMAAAAAENPGEPALRAALAVTYCDLGRLDDARAVIGDDIDDGFAAFPDNLTLMLSLASLAEICVHLRRIDGAALVYGRLAPWHSQVIAMYAVIAGPVAFYLGTLATLLGRGEEAHDHFVEALDLSHRMGSPYWIARTQVGWARLLRGLGAVESGRAEAMLESALSTARRYGFIPLAQQAEALRRPNPREVP